MRKPRKNYSPQEKLAIIRRHLCDKVPVLGLCRELRLQPTVYYRWLNQFFDNGAIVLGRKPTAQRPDVPQRRLERARQHLRDQESKQTAQEWMISLTQGQLGAKDVRQTTGDTLNPEDIATLLTCISNSPLKHRNRAVALLSFRHGILVSHIARFLGVSHSSVDTWVRKFAQHGCRLLLPFTSEYCKAKDNTYRDAVFEILHAPPSTYGINRTTWRLRDIHSVMASRQLPLAQSNIRQIIKDAGYCYRRAKRVLTSTDPDYLEKLKDITRTLQNLGPREKFFSIDEYGPFAVKIQGGKSLAQRGHARTVPLRQRSKGVLIITAALELSTNQITHFYSPAKNTMEMIALLHRLVDIYADQECIYLSWDAASWHASKTFKASVNAINSMSGKHPQVKLVPLPCCAQFLNVIESVFSGMARAVIHNSDFSSLDAARDVIDKYFAERNAQFLQNPKRAGRKIWGDERVPSRFSVSHNCKDPRYR